MIEELKRAGEVLQMGGLILYPTDTMWAIGCDASNFEAVNKICALTQRSQSKDMLILLDSANRLSQYLHEVPEIAYELIEVSDKPLTIIYHKAKNLASNLIAEDGSIGIQITHDNFCEKLIGRLRKPLVSTSANIGGTKVPFCFKEVSPDVISGVDYVVNWRQDDQTQRPVSSIIKLDAAGRFSLIR